MKMNNGSKCQTEDTTLNAKQNMSLNIWNECVALNAERKMNDGSERQNEKCDNIELRHAMALNTEQKEWLWKPN